MRFSFVRAKLPTLLNILFTILSAALLVMAFPNFDLWFLAWFALIPFFYAIEREKDSIIKSFVLGWIFGTIFFFGSCWWMSFAMNTYGGIPIFLAYFLVFIIVSIVGLYMAVFAGLLSLLLKRFGSHAIFAAPFLWTALEFTRYWITFNNWNAIAYSQAFIPEFIQSAQYGGIYLVGFLILMTNAFLSFIFLPVQKTKLAYRLVPVGGMLIVILTIVFSMQNTSTASMTSNEEIAKEDLVNVVAIQPNVPMSGLNYEKWKKLRERHANLAEKAISELKLKQPDADEKPLLVIFPESPMNFMYQEDEDFRSFLNSFAVKHKAFVLFNSAEPNAAKGNYFNSAIVVNPAGRKIGQYDKIHLVPFGEYVPLPKAVSQNIPTLVGNFELGSEYDLFDINGVTAGIMICYESHFPTLSREFVKNGADVLIEMTNDGYLGPTGVLKQHLASAVFRAIETNRPVLRTTNIGITGYITSRGEIQNPAESYTEDTRIWSMTKSDGSKTFYVKYGDWFAWISIFVSLILLGLSFYKWNKDKMKAI